MNKALFAIALMFTSLFLIGFDVSGVRAGLIELAASHGGVLMSDLDVMLLMVFFGTAMMTYISRDWPAPR